jgi:hypothetical protein
MFFLRNRRGAEGTEEEKEEKGRERKRKEEKGKLKVKILYFCLLPFNF